MNTKTPIVNFFAENLPEFIFDAASRPNLLFRRLLQDGLFECIAVQRDSKSHALAPNFAVTYNPSWHGEPAMPLGWDWGIANIRHQSPAVPAIEQWYVYAPTLDGLLTTLESVLGDFRSLVLPFYCEATTFLRKDVLLQTAIRERVYMARPDKKELQDALAAVDYRLDRLEHPAYVQLRDRLRLRWKDVTKEKRGWTNRVAIDSLLLL